MGEIKIDIKPDVRPVKKRPYKLAHKYKEIVKKKIDFWSLAVCCGTPSHRNFSP